MSSRPPVPLWKVAALSRRENPTRTKRRQQAQDRIAKRLALDYALRFFEKHPCDGPFSTVEQCFGFARCARMDPPSLARVPSRWGRRLKILYTINSPRYLRRLKYRPRLTRRRTRITP